jgi:hypothetical protein
MLHVGYSIHYVAHDFFGPQLVKNADVFLARAILHDYSDDLCLDFLRQLRSAAKPTTQLLIVDNIMFHTCDEAEMDEIQGGKMFDPQAPLLRNLGAANLSTHLADLLVRYCHNSVREF